MIEWLNEWQWQFHDSIPSSFKAGVDSFHIFEPLPYFTSDGNLWPVGHLYRYFFRGLCFCSQHDAQTYGKQVINVINMCVWELPNPHKVSNSWGTCYLVHPGTFIFTFEMFHHLESWKDSWNLFPRHTDGIDLALTAFLSPRRNRLRRCDSLLWYPEGLRKSRMIWWYLMPSWFFKSFTFDCENEQHCCSSMSLKKSRFGSMLSNTI